VNLSPGFSSPHDTIGSQPVPANPTHQPLSRSKRQSIIKSLPLPANRIHPSAPGRPMTDGPRASLPPHGIGRGAFQAGPHHAPAARRPFPSPAASPRGCSSPRSFSFVSAPISLPPRLKKICRDRNRSPANPPHLLWRKRRQHGEENREGKAKGERRLPAR
jgi:hypothetical protein